MYRRSKIRFTKAFNPLLTLLLISAFLLFRSEAAVIVEWNAPPRSSPWELVADHDGQVWFIKSYGNGICRLDPNTGDILDFTLIGVTPWGISADTEQYGDKGSWIYFTDLLTARIYRINAKTKADFDVFYLNLGDEYVSQLRGIHVQNSTRIWFASYGTHRVGLLNLSSTSSPPRYNVTYWTFSSDCSPFSLVYDDETGLWFTDETGDKIGNIPNPITSIVNFYHLRDGSIPVDIDVDSFGNVWFTESGNNRIGRINPKLNELTEYLLPMSDSNPYGITVDYSNRVWVALRNKNTIAAFNPETNTFSLYERVGLGEPTFVATSKEGRTPVFFTDSLVHKIGKIDPNLEVTTVLGGSLSTVSTSMTTGSSKTTLTEGNTTGRFSDIHLSKATTAEKMGREGSATTYTVSETVTLIRTSATEVTTHYITETLTSYVATTTDTLTTVKYETITSYVFTKTGTLTTYTITTAYTPTSPATGVIIVPGYQASSILMGLIAGSTVLLGWHILIDRFKRGSKSK